MFRRATDLIWALAEKDNLSFSAFLFINTYCVFKDVKDPLNKKI